MLKGALDKYNIIHPTSNFFKTKENKQTNKQKQQPKKKKKQTNKKQNKHTNKTKQNKTNKSWDFNTIRSVSMGDDCMLNFTHD